MATYRAPCGFPEQPDSFGNTSVALWLFLPVALEAGVLEPRDSEP